MTRDEFIDVVTRYPELRATLNDHPDETWEWAKAVLELERLPTIEPDMPANAPERERGFWAQRRKAREDQR